ncbi:MAG TPA: DUF5335 domain-containing protein [Alphaproteobacteria bacterium]|jgi:hypothetical protein|nr:DUF5335 domain-containing protein [Alphaproteobacteria bacterium]
MTTRNLDRSEWQGFFDGLSRLLEGKQADIRVESLAIGSQVAVKWLPLLGITYDPKDDLLEIALDGVDHMIRKPQRILAEVGTEGLKNLEIVDGDNVRQVVELRDPLMLPARAAT